MSAAIETLWKVYQTVNDWIRSADTKAEVVLVTDGAIATVAATVASFTDSFFQSHPAALVAGTVGLVAVVISALFSVAALQPSVSCPSESSLIFFGAIRGGFKTANEYEQAVRQVFPDEAQALREISHQVWVNSCIASRKYTTVAWAVGLLGGAIVLFAVTALLATLPHQ